MGERSIEYLKVGEVIIEHISNLTLALIYNHHVF